MDESTRNYQTKSGSENLGFVTNENKENFENKDSSFATLELDLDVQIQNKSNGVKPSQLTVVDLSTIEECSKEHNNDNNNINNLLARIVVKVRCECQNFLILHKVYVKIGFIISLILLYHIYLICAIIHNITNQLSFGWCNGLGFLIVLTGLVYWGLFYYIVLKSMLGNKIKHSIIIPFKTRLRPIWERGYTKIVLSLVGVIGFLIFLIADTIDQPRRLISALGIPILVLSGLIMSKHPGHVKWRQVFWAMSLQFGFGLIILRWPPGRDFLDCLSEKVKTFLDFSTVGSDFLYGYLSSGKPTEDLIFPTIFVFRGLSTIFFFGFMISLLYHYGIMQWVIIKLGWLLSITIGTTAAESMNAAANIFIGQSEAPLLIKPFINQMTKSELHAMMAGGFATIAGTVMAAYISYGISASFLLSASVMAAPAALGFAKLIYPETKISITTSKDIKLIQTKSEGSALDAACNGAMQAVTLIGCIVANVIAFVSFVAFLNAIMSWFGALVGFEQLSFEAILGKVFIPIAWIMGVDAEETEQVALLLGLKMVANEFIAYKRLGEMSISPRSKAIATYALCSFANIGSVGVQLGGLTVIAPDRRKDIAKTIGRAFLTGTLVGFLNACMAGMLLSEPGFSEWNSSQNLSMFLNTSL